METAIQTLEEKFLSTFEAHLSKIEEACGDSVNKHRAAARDKFAELGLPTRALEDFQHTDVSKFFDAGYKTDFAHKPESTDLYQVFKCDVPNLNSHLVFTVNGWYYSKNLLSSGLPEGVIIESFAKASKDYPELFEKYYNKQAGESTDGSVHMNTMMAQDGLFIYIPKGVVMEQPVQIINILNSQDELLSNQRGLFVIEENAQAKVLICDHTETHNHYTSNHVREIFAAENAVFDYYLIENQHNRVRQIISTFTDQKANSNVLTNIITLHNGKTRNNSFVKLDGEGAEAHLYGMALTDKDQHVDNFSFIDHAIKNCTSTELFKNVLDDQSTGAFRGRILVREGASKTLAYQTNNNVCMSKNAKMNTKPQLEIYNDDVKCSHGATTGQIDENAMFYMRARGIDEGEARLLLMYAFCDDVIENIRLESLRERIKDLVEKRFRGELSKCAGCAICN